MAYRVVIIDDESWNIIDIRSTFPWADYGFEVVAEFKKPAEALEVIQRILPEVVVTDIRMPVMSGLELIRKVRELGISTEFIIISGYAEFSYAQEAVRLGAFDYCLKPLEKEWAQEVLKKLSLHLSKKYRPDPKNEAEDASRPVGDDESNHGFEKLLKHMCYYLHTKMQLRDLAKMFYMNPNYCCELFQKNTGMTFSQYLTKIRMEEAGRLIMDKSLSIEEIALRTGHHDYSYFSRVFKRFYGMAPAEFRKRGEEHAKTVE